MVASPHDTEWAADARSILDQAIDAHGGGVRWAGVEAIKVNVRARFPLLMLKGVSPHMRSFSITLETRRIYARLQDYPGRGCSGYFSGDRVWIENSDGTRIKERSIVSSADGVASHQLWWDELDFLYFLGYAMWNYKNTPFLFMQEGFDLTALPPFAIGGGRWWHPLQVTYPLGFPTHSRQQTFYFDEGGLLRRLDYRADVISRWAIGAHLCERHASFGGLVYPTYRRVLGGWFPRHLPPFPKAVEAWIDDIDIEWRDSRLAPNP